MSGYLVFQIVIFIVLAIGISLVIYALVKFSSNSKSDSGNNGDKFNNQTSFINEEKLDKAMKYIDSSVSEIDKTVEEFNNLTKSVFQEIDEKYQELLFLYTLMDDKKNEIANLYSVPTKQEPTDIQPMLSKTPTSPQPSQTPQSLQTVQSTSVAPMSISTPQSEQAHRPREKSVKNVINNPKLQQIVELEKEGLPLSEIAKRLDMGQGEVRLILELGRVR